MTDEMQLILDDHERRIRKLEEALSPTENKRQRVSKKQYEGLAGGIRFLIDQGIFSTPRYRKEISESLEKEGYHYSIQSVDKTLRVDFCKNRKILTRIKADKGWKYVLRK